MSEDKDWHELPPVTHPAREAFAFCTVAALVAGLIGYGLWSLVGRVFGV